MTYTPRAVDRENPWPGLAAFEEGDHDFFKGREDEALTILRLILRQDLTLLWGFSGLGKTSLLRAGLFPRLRAVDVFPVYVRLRYDAIGAGQATTADALPSFVEQCLQAIEAAAERWHYEIPREPAATLWEYARRRDQRFWGPGDRLVTPLLVFDQFEELFARTRSDAAWTEISRFFRDLTDTITGCPPDWLLEATSTTPADGDAAGGDQSDRLLFGTGVFKVMLSFREDFLARVAAFAPLVRGIDHNYFRLQSMTFDQALAVVEEAGGHLIDARSPEEKSRISKSIVARVADAPTPSSQTSATVDPGLLSLFCRELNEKRRQHSKDVIDRELVESAAARQIIAQFYESSMAAVSAATRQFVEDRLVLRESRSRDSVPEEVAKSAGAIEAELALLIERRILRRDEVARGARTIARLELTHDVLVEPALAARDRRELVEQQVKEERERRERAEQEKEIAARRRKRVIAALAAVVGFLVVLSLVLYIVAVRDGAANRDRLITATIERAVDDSAAGRPAESLARLASVLREQPANAAVRSLTLDLLLRRMWLVPVASIRSSLGQLTSAEFNARGNLLATATTAGEVELWETDTGRRLGEALPPTTADLGLRFSHDDKWLVTGSGSGSVSIWDGVTLGPIARLPQTSPIKGFALPFGAGGARDALTIATWSEDGVVRTWIVDAKGARESGRFAAGRPESCPQSASSPGCLEFARDATRLLMRSGATAVIWDTVTRRRVRTMTHASPLKLAQFSPDGQMVLGGTADGRLYLWDAVDGRPAAQTTPDRGPVTTATFDREGSRLVTTFLLPETLVQPSATIWTIGSRAEPSSPGRTLDRAAVVWTPEADLDGVFADDAVLITRSESGVRLIDARSGLPLAAALPMEARAMQLDRRRRRLLIVDRDGAVKVWVLRTPAPTIDLPTNGAVFSGQFSRDGQRVLTASLDGTARIWDVNTRYTVRTLVHAARVLSAEYSADEQRILTSTGERLQVWATETGERLAEIPAATGVFIAARFNAAATLIVTASLNDHARVWDTNTGRLVRELPEARKLWYAEFSRAGDRIVTASEEGVAAVWDVATGTRIGRPLAHDARVVSARFNEDGTRVVTASADRTAKVWTIDGAAAPITLPHLGSVTSAQFGSDGQHVITTSQDQTARIWTLDGQSPAVLTLWHEAPVDFAELDPARRRLLTVASHAGEIRMWDAVSGRAISRSLTSQSAVWSVRFSPDGQKIVAASDDDVARILGVPSGQEDDATWLATLAEAVAGLRVDESGGIQRAMDRGTRLQELRAEAGATQGDLFRGRFFRWFFLDDPSGL